MTFIGCMIIAGAIWFASESLEERLMLLTKVIAKANGLQRTEAGAEEDAEE